DQFKDDPSRYVRPESQPTVEGDSVQSQSSGSDNQPYAPNALGKRRSGVPFAPCASVSQISSEVCGIAEMLAASIVFRRKTSSRSPFREGRAPSSAYPVSCASGCAFAEATR